MEPKISVVIPAYNVAPYLRECLDSVLSQTYENLEVLLVDDGSTDETPVLCDAYAARDGRITVIHRENGGISAARNSGLDAATGEFIGFVDADDRAAPQLYRLLYDGLIRLDADISVCNFYHEDPVRKTLDEEGPRAEAVLQNGDATRLLLRDEELKNYMWNKLFRAELFECIRFPAGEKFEDISTTYKLFERARRVALLPVSAYYYIYRGESIVRIHSFANEVECVSAGLSRYEALKDKYPEYRPVMAFTIMHTITKVWGLAWDNRELIKTGYQQTLESFADFSRQYKNDYIPTRRLGITGRMTLRLLPYAKPWAFYLTHLLHRIYRFRHHT